MSSPNYSEILVQLSTNLQNTLNTFGPSSPQYQAVLQTLRDCIREMERQTVSTDPEMLNFAMQLLNIH
ncbi:hypothetical protein VTN49DRAFT_1096 [Thermomyces lanuginosus]|uniref:uncharacterized protein n=1 Tax=Thermomyces lanuginosus TaxID=5541 RepID=UPI0037432BFB